MYGHFLLVQKTEPAETAGSQRVEKPLPGLSAKSLQSAARIICLPEADKFHTCSLRSILRQVHALTQNVCNFIFC